VNIGTSLALADYYYYPHSSPHFLKQKNRQGREFFPKRIGSVFLKLALDYHIECSRRATTISPIRGADEPGAPQWRRYARALRFK
jgi:hypothetical protein